MFFNDYQRIMVMKFNFRLINRLTNIFTLVHPHIEGYFEASSTV